MAQTRKLAGFKRIGGLYHWRIGAIGGTFYRARKRSVYDYVQCGNTIDIFERRTGRTVAFLNIGTTPARAAFAAWQRQDRAIGAHLTRAVEYIALAGIAAMVAVSIVL